MTLGVGIVGTGWVSGDHIRAFEDNPHTEVRALCSRSETRATTLEDAHLVDCILNDKESHVNVADAYTTHEICFAADLSGKSGQPVRLPLP